ncbi:MAG: hypothetical protein M3O20_07245 [Acidobacteriota bacterium]|nr:hypothetical protein [Acidobacteriota bacterium]
MAVLKNHPALETAHVSHSGLEVVVLHAETQETIGALKMAADLASGLAPVRLVAIQEVPYPLPLDAPAVSVEFLEKRFLNMISAAGVDARVDIRLCRDARDVMEREFGPHCVVVIGGRRRWWRASARRLARRLEILGHQVVFVN